MVRLRYLLLHHLANSQILTSALIIGIIILGTFRIQTFLVLNLSFECSNLLQIDSVLSFEEINFILHIGNDLIFLLQFKTFLFEGLNEPFNFGLIFAHSICEGVIVTIQRLIHNRTCHPLPHGFLPMRGLRALRLRKNSPSIQGRRTPLSLSVMRGSL